MKNTFFLIVIGFLLLSCGSKSFHNKRLQVNATIDLVNVVDDKIAVTIIPPAITSENIIFYMPEIVPGTYNDSDFGKYIENLEAFNTKGENLTIAKQGDNAWSISNAQELARLSYLINDTFDTESDHDIFSPSGTNIDVNKQFMLNLHGVLGYFDGKKEIPYQLAIHRPTQMTASTSLSIIGNTTIVEEFPNLEQVDHFYATRYFQIIDNPIMYNEPNKEVFQVGDIEIELSVYSPSGAIKALDLKPNIEEMIKAQKSYLGSINATAKYSILLYLSSLAPDDAQGFGALEHHTSTVVVLPEGMPRQALDEALLDVVSHEFFHTVTPLTVHSNEIHNFSYNEPLMSEHLWMYEGITEYFAQHFQVHQGLTTSAEFYETIVEKISASKSYDDTMSFTEMSKNVLEKPYADAYDNVYQKGALIGMCLDILLRQSSNGEQGVLELMKLLSDRYGIEKPFNDTTIIEEIVSLTSPDIGIFFENHVIGNTPIPYEEYFKKVGLTFETQKAPSGYFLDGNQPFIDVNQSTNKLYIRSGIPLNTFMTDLGIEGGDIIERINDKSYTLQNVRELIINSQSWKEGDDINFVVKRGGEEMTLSGQITPSFVDKASLVELQYFKEGPELRLRNSWLKG